MVPVYLLGGLVAGYWVFNDARKKGNDLSAIGLWAVGTVIMPIVFLPLYLLLGRKSGEIAPPMPYKNRQDVIDVEAVPVEETSRCLICGSEIKLEFSVCPYCGQDVQPRYCSCGRKLEKDWCVCPFCQTPLEEKINDQN